MNSITYNVSFPGLGINLKINPIAFQCPGIKIYWYGIIISLGFLLAYSYIESRKKDFEFNYAYKLNLTIKEKIETIAKKIYGADGVEYVEGIEEKIAEIERMGYGNLPICIAKTQYSLSDDQKNLECNEPFNIHIQDVILKAGAEFIVIITGKIMTMPGLPKVPAAESIDVDNNGNIVGIF